ncbi:MAG: translation elongation factor Ts [Actinomycetota bacterium]|jgi:elongation factor Ts|nr:translation elongation factor Ts [Actinomycetota bacterium]
MAAFTAKDIQSLRQRTGVGMLDAKRALEESSGDMDEAVNWLRIQGLAGAAKRADREASQGAVAIGRDGNAVAIVQLRCETDFVAKSDAFVALTQELAQLVAAKGEGAEADRADEVDRLKTTLKENISIGRVVRVEARDGGAVDGYLHLQAGRGVNAVIVAVSGGSEALAHDIAAHIAFARPAYISRDEVPQEDVDAERRTVEEIARNEGKPDAALPKIVEGRLNGWYRERVLLDQPFIKDEKKTIAQLLAGAVVDRFAQVVIGD